MTFDIRKAKRQETATFKFYRLSPDPKNPIEIQTKHLGSTNKAYVDAIFTRQPTTTDAKGIELWAFARTEDMRDLALYCAESWNVTQDGKPIECTPEKVQAFLEFALANGYQDEIDDYRAWAKILGNFREPLTEGTELGKK